MSNPRPSVRISPQQMPRGPFLGASLRIGWLPVKNLSYEELMLMDNFGIHCSCCRKCPEREQLKLKAIIKLRQLREWLKKQSGGGIVIRFGPKANRNTLITLGMRATLLALGKDDDKRENLMRKFLNKLGHGVDA